MPSEWPRQTVTALVARNSASASQVNTIGTPTTPTTVMDEIQSDLTGFQCTAPATASVPQASTMRGERNVLSERCKASSTASNVMPSSATASVMAFLHNTRTGLWSYNLIVI